MVDGWIVALTLLPGSALRVCAEAFVVRVGRAHRAVRGPRFAVGVAGTVASVAIGRHWGRAGSGWHEIAGLGAARGAGEGAGKFVDIVALNECGDQMFMSGEIERCGVWHGEMVVRGGGAGVVHWWCWWLR